MIELTQFEYEQRRKKKDALLQRLFYIETETMRMAREKIDIQTQLAVIYDVEIAECNARKLKEEQSSK